MNRNTFAISKILPLPTNFLKAADSLCEYDKVLLQPIGNFQSYHWSNGDFQPVITLSKAGNYVLTVKDIHGCTGIDTIQIVQKNCLAGVFIPNAFTPNKDQLNDVFRAKVYGIIITFRLQVYNRFGELVFTNPDPQKGWEGNFNGKSEDTGTFIWKCYYYLEGSKPTVEKGTVVLIR